MLGPLGAHKDPIWRKETLTTSPVVRVFSLRLQAATPALRDNSFRVVNSPEGDPDLRSSRLGLAFWVPSRRPRLLANREGPGAVIGEPGPSAPSRRNRKGAPRT